MSWTYEGTPVTETPEEYGAFVYLITNLTNNKKYIGKKIFWSKRRKKPLKGKKRNRIVKTPSNWLKYWGSSDDLLADIETLGEENFSREIIHMCKHRKESTFLEAMEHFNRNVLYALAESGEREYYNGNILAKFFRKDSPTLLEKYENV